MAAPYCRTSFADGQTSGTSNRTVTGTPAVGDLWILLVSLSGNTSGTVTATDTNGGKYVALPNALFGASANNLVVLVRTQFFANTTPTTVTVNSGSNTAGEIVVLAYQGLSFPGLNAVRNSGSQANQAASGTPAPLMGGSALVSNPILSVIANSSDPGGVTKPSGWTLQQDAGQNTPNTGITVATLDSGFSGTTVTWGGPSATGFASYAVELDASYEPVVQSFGSTQLLWYFGGRSSLLNTGSAIWTPTIGISTIVGTTSPAATTLPNGVMLPTWNGTSSQLSTNGNNEVNHAIELQTLPALSNYQRVSFIVCESTQSQAYALRFNNDGIGLNTSGLNAGQSRALRQLGAPPFIRYADEE